MAGGIDDADEIHAEFRVLLEALDDGPRVGAGADLLQQAHERRLGWIEQRTFEHHGPCEEEPLEPVEPCVEARIELVVGLDLLRHGQLDGPSQRSREPTQRTALDRGQVDLDDVGVGQQPRARIVDDPVVEGDRVAGLAQRATAGLDLTIGLDVLEQLEHDALLRQRVDRVGQEDLARDVEEAGEPPSTVSSPSEAKVLAMTRMAAAFCSSKSATVERRERR